MEEANVDNIVLFVGDAVRYDASADALSAEGPTYKTSAASLHTPASFASMLTGLNVPSHGVVGFQNILPDAIDSLVDLPGWNTAFSNKTGTMHEDMHRIFRTPSSSSLEEIERPFVWVVRDPGSHAPYNGYDPETFDQLHETGPEYLNRVAGDDDRICRDYGNAVDASLSRFKEAIECIRKRGLEEETLFVYMSDHGELLGEHGLLGHNHVACPELVYVPTTFVHPELEAGLEDELLRHIDLLPTLLDFLGFDTDRSQLDGRSVFEGGERIGYNHFETVFYANEFLSGFSNIVRSCWDRDGGHVFVESSHVDALAIYAGLLTLSYKGKQMLRDKNPLQALRLLLPGHTRHGFPAFTRQEASAHIDRIGQRSSVSVQAELNDDTKERLSELGYL